MAGRIVLNFAQSKKKDNTSTNALPTLPHLPRTWLAAASAARPSQAVLNCTAALERRNAKDLLSAGAFTQLLPCSSHLAMGQKPGYPPVNIRFHPTTKIGSLKWAANSPKNRPKWVPIQNGLTTTTAIWPICTPRLVPQSSKGLPGQGPHTRVSRQKQLPFCAHKQGSVFVCFSSLRGGLKHLAGSLLAKSSTGFKRAHFGGSQKTET